MSEDCIFCKIVNGQIPCDKIYEDENCLAFLDIFPKTKGHTLVITKKHIKDVFEATEDDYAKLFTSVNKVCKLLKDKIPCDGIHLIQNNGKAAGPEVLHTHIHLMPRFKDDGKNIFPDKESFKYNDNEKEELLKKLNE